MRGVGYTEYYLLYSTGCVWLVIPRCEEEVRHKAYFTGVRSVHSIHSIHSIHGTAHHITSPDIGWGLRRINYPSSNLY